MAVTVEGPCRVRLATCASALGAWLAVGTVLLSIQLLFDWVSVGVDPSSQQGLLAALGALVLAQCCAFVLNSFLYYGVFLEEKRLIAEEIVRCCRSQELLFSYWDRGQLYGT